MKTADGHEYHGLIAHDKAPELEFIEVMQPPGRPMFLVVRPLDPAKVVERKPLPKAERDELAARIHQFRNRAVIEAGRMDDVRLAPPSNTQPPQLTYAGPWFQLTSSTDEETTRRSVVRIEQIFRAYRQVLPPRTQQPGILSVRLFGSIDEYQKHLVLERRTLEHLAYFQQRENTIVAGSDLARFAEHLAAARAANDAVRKQCDTLKAEIPARLAKLAADLAQQGYSRDEVQEEVTAHRRAWEEECVRRQREINEANRRNELRFAEVTRRMFTRLSHEAFHAYLENFVYPHDKFDVPRWLNEGLAQIFESGQLEADQLRIDAPAREPLELLQKNIGSSTPLALADFLAADDAAFLVSHGAAGGSQQHYAYSWGLAWYLTFQHNLLDTPKLDEYVSLSAKSLSPIERFEKLVGQPLPEFERRWRAAMRELKPGK